ncbi:ribonuclease-3 family protein [Clostridium sp. USBA 49]|jgi:ribonuclease-3 family protein|uniref:Mini-ribonuclease 3 n=1 Tax=Clostridium TaxID=1485 RepID=UPI000999384C|nr:MULTISPECIES: Mini-ribonuclease 3 [Clostridium]SKA77871.1 ribonuclease-3 family protein [Clostridium sp. USBA 49]
MDFDLFKKKFTTKEAAQLNPLVLAFVGDAVYEVFIRTYLIDKNRDMSVHKLHKEAISFVKAHSQSEFMKKLENELSKEEIIIFKRGRNSKSATVPKNADVQEYRIATGFESLLGFLYLTEQNERLNYILNTVIKLRCEDQRKG